MKKNIQLLLFMLVFVKITVAQLPNYVPTNGLVAFWPFNGNANDVSGNGINGTVNGPTLTTDRFGNLNNAYSFVGTTTNSDIITGNCSTFPSGNSPRSVSVWYKGINVSNTYQQLLGYGGQNCGESFIINFNNPQIPISSNGKYEIQGHCQAFRQHNNSPTPLNNVWNQIVVTYDGSVFRFYNNGILVNTSSATTLNVVTTSKIFCFGKQTNPSGTAPYFLDGVPGFNGSIDDIGIWNRALTQQEITNLYIACGDTFNNQPVSVVGAKGTNCNFSSAITGSGNNYQWQSNAANLGWQNVPNSNPYVGSNTNNLSVNGLTVSNHNQRFRVIASKSGCADTSNVVSITLSNIASDSLALISLKSDTTTKGNRIRQLEIDLANNRDTLYVGSNITTDTLIISIRTGLSTASSLVNTLRVYPNPAATIINIELQKPGTYIAKISGITGQTIVTQTAGTIDISTLASGVYVLSIFDTNNKLVSTNKISVVR